ncbi:MULTISPECIES: response regulator [Niastella]|uniref:Response regulator n=1 Tax=Niastella soli TaxID=2821487 RepID=A0ABS3YW21_9BACT|nr:response regulator [Niastella soli]MBO9201943.1 response regulator [Niastella soli]
MRPQIVLHVDDDPDDRFLVSSAINSINPSIKVLEAENGLKAIDILRKARIAGELPSLVILDFNMPLMNGMETYKEIRKHPEFGSIPVVLLTTFKSRREDEYWNDESVATFTKPATFNELTTDIKKILSYCHPYSI